MVDWSILQRQPMVIQAQPEQSGFQQAMQGIQSGLQTGAGIASGIDQYRQGQAKDAARERQAAFNTAFGQAYQSGDKKAVTDLIGKFPEQFAAIKQIAGFQDEQQNKAFGSLGLQLKGAIESNNPQAAAQLIAANKDVLRNAGPGFEPEGLLAVLQKDPQALAQRADMFALTSLGPEQYYKVSGQRETNQTNRRGQDITARGQDVTMRGQDLQQQEGQANRAIAAANLGLRQQELKIKAIEANNKDIDRSLARETNDLRRQELQQKLESNAAKSAQAKADLAATATTALNTYDRGIKTVDDILASPGLSSVVGVPGPSRYIPGTDAQATIGLIETLKSQTFLNEVEKMKGLGALTESEGAKITSAVGSLNTSMSEKDFQKSLRQIQDYFKAGKANTEKKYGGVLTQNPSPTNGAAPASANPPVQNGGIKFLGFE